ncbi:hypothetical protein DBR36_15815 [Microbacterium sp. HMWF026]|uniref:hypothetical protein n=1 Tax=Microbacterium sp. HMWF026 TaxID=2056861 RepID=UPI000D3B9AA1|nr:hypothetical protein [Microbacterium sp. HMWF026]PTT14639.1 hypothetical protein DBR36_15815 [Microbacterium sp. HMWF026]
MKTEFIDLIDDTAAVIEALNFVKTRMGASRHQWLHEQDVWVREALTASTTDSGFEKQPDPGRAIVVESVTTSTLDTDDSVLRGRHWRYASEVDGPLQGVDMIDGGLISSCHRHEAFDLFDRTRAVAIVYIPRGRYITEFAFCQECVNTLGLHDAITYPKAG